MLRNDIEGRAYAPPAWWTGPRPESDHPSGKQADHRADSDLFRRTGDR